MKTSVNIDVNTSNNQLIDSVKKTIVQQPDYKGIGGHGVENHGGHGTHTQSSIGLGTSTINFRRKI